MMEKAKCPKIGKTELEEYLEEFFISKDKIDGLTKQLNNNLQTAFDEKSKHKVSDPNFNFWLGHADALRLALGLLEEVQKK